MSNPAGHKEDLPYPTQTLSDSSIPYASAPYPAEYQTGAQYYPQPPPPYSPTYPEQYTHINNPPMATGQQPTVTLVNVPAPIMYTGGLGAESNTMVCPHCQATIRTKIEKHNSNSAYLSGFIIAIFGCFCGCCLIPCCMDSCKTTEHNCPNCGRFLGRYSKYF